MTQDVYKHFLATVALNPSLIHLELPPLEGVFNIYNICGCAKTSSVAIISDGAYPQNMQEIKGCQKFNYFLGIFVIVQLHCKVDCA